MPVINPDNIYVFIRELFAKKLLKHFPDFQFAQIDKSLVDSYKNSIASITLSMLSISISFKMMEFFFVLCLFVL